VSSDVYVRAPIILISVPVMQLINKAMNMQTGMKRDQRTDSGMSDDFAGAIVFPRGAVIY